MHTTHQRRNASFIQMALAATASALVLSADSAKAQIHRHSLSLLICDTDYECDSQPRVLLTAKRVRLIQ